MTNPAKPYNDIQERAYRFGLSTARMIDSLPKQVSVYTIARQLIRSATSVGANILEGNYASSKKEFLQYINIARKSAKESEYWLRMLTDLMPAKDRLEPLSKECDELIRILSTIILNARRNLKS